MSSILSLVKEHVGLTEDCVDFDKILIAHTNTTFLKTRLLGVGPRNGYAISSELDTWDDAFPNLKDDDLEAVKSFIGIRVRLLFDPPTQQALLTALKEEAARLEWELNVQVETPAVAKGE